MNDKQMFKTVLLLALPASGKSEVRKYLEHVPEAKRIPDFHMGETVQLDDYPYVHMMRRIDDEAANMGQPRIFFHSGIRPFINPLEWGTLIHLVNEDYADVVSGKELNPASAAENLFDRIDQAAAKVGLPPRLANLDGKAREALINTLESEAWNVIEDKRKVQAQGLDGKTLVIEFARGGPQGSEMPLTGGFGYQYSLTQVADDILKDAVILYIWVTPEESRRKNDERAKPGLEGDSSILHHGVPIEVMLNDYGCDDMSYLEEISEKPGTITVDKKGQKYYLPIGRFDNRVDKTSFLRVDPEDWDAKKVEAVHDGIKSAIDKIAELVF